jgi:hypothetical protein
MIDCDFDGMSSLFSYLWRQCSKETKPKENFFSAIVAELFKTHPEFLFQWLDALGVKLTQRAAPEISFQECFRSESGEQGIYDLFIRLRNGAWRPSHCRRIKDRQHGHVRPIAEISG